MFVPEGVFIRGSTVLDMPNKECFLDFASIAVACMQQSVCPSYHIAIARHVQGQI